MGVVETKRLIFFGTQNIFHSSVAVQFSFFPHRLHTLGWKNSDHPDGQERGTEEYQGDDDDTW